MNIHVVALQLFNSRIPIQQQNAEMQDEINNIKQSLFNPFNRFMYSIEKPLRWRINGSLSPSFIFSLIIFNSSLLESMKE